MVYKKFGILSAVDTDLDTIPWANVFAKAVTDYDEMYFITCIRPFDTGLMVVTGYFKGYIHKGDKLHDHLLEACKVWCEQEYGTVDTLLCQLSRKGKIMLVQDDETKVHMWHSSGGMYSQFAGGVLAMEEDSSNPFLAGMGLRSARASEEPEKQQSSLPKTPPNGSAKARKAH